MKCFEMDDFDLLELHPELL